MLDHSLGPDRAYIVASHIRFCLVGGLGIVCVYAVSSESSTGRKFAESNLTGIL